jgi:hypothetical protein
MGFPCFRRLFFFLLLPAVCGFFPAPLCGQNISDIVGDSFEEVEGRGLAIRTRPAGARVFIDGMERGQTPLVINNLRSGEYHIRLVKEGWRERRFKITLSASSRLVVSIELEEAAGQVLLRIRKAEGSPPEDQLPFNPAIFTGGESAAVYPGSEGTHLVSLPVGYRTLQVRAFGWEEEVKTVYVREGHTVSVDFTLKPAAFAMSRGAVSRPRFNPANSGSLGQTEFRFEVSAPGQGTLTIRDQEGRAVFAVPLGPFQTWRQSAVWNGRGAEGDPLPPGVYQARIETESLAGDGSEPVSQQLELGVEIDASINIYPLSLQGVLGGLLFAPLPGALPPGSFQIEGGLFFGQTAPLERPFAALPFDVGIRFSPLDRLEISALLNALPKFDDTAAWGIAGSAKWVFLRGDGIPLGLAAGLSYAWENGPGAAPLGPGSGLGFWLPLSWNFSPLSLLFSPGMRLPLPGDPIPRLLLSGGLLFQGPWFTAGLSLRPEFNFSESSGTGKDGGPVFLLMGGEIKFYPPPSNLVFTLSGGAWLNGSGIGGFGGAGIGLIF